MSSARAISIIALFTSLIIATDYGLAPFPNVKLLDTVVFSSAYAFGFKLGAAIAICSELVWSLISPYGFAGLIIPFTVGGEILFAFAGYFASRIWGKPDGLSVFSAKNTFFGAFLLICAFVWDFETNIGTGLITGARNLPALLSFLVVGIPFMIPHEIADFVFGSLLAPIIIVYFWRIFRGRKSTIFSATTTGSQINQGGGSMQ